MSKEFGDKIYQLRHAAGFTQQQIADQLNVDRSTYSNYERARSEPTFKTVNKIAQIFDVSVSSLLSNDEKYIKVADRTGVPSYNLTKDEKKLLIRYRLLDKKQKKACFDYMGEFLITEDEKI